MKKLILLALTALTLMACADNGVSAPGADEPSNNNNNGNCVDVIIGYSDVIPGGAYTEFSDEWDKKAFDGVNWDYTTKVIVKKCI